LQIVYSSEKRENLKKFSFLLEKFEISRVEKSVLYCPILNFFMSLENIKNFSVQIFISNLYIKSALFLPESFNE